MEDVGAPREAPQLLARPLRRARLVEHLVLEGGDLVPADDDGLGMEGRDRLRLRGGQALGQLRRIGLAGVERCLVDPGGHAGERDAEPLEEGSASRGGAREDEVHAQCLCPASSWLPWCSRMCLASSAVK